MYKYLLSKECKKQLWKFSHILTVSFMHHYVQQLHSSTLYIGQKVLSVNFLLRPENSMSLYRIMIKKKIGLSFPNFYCRCRKLKMSLYRMKNALGRFVPTDLCRYNENVSVSNVSVTRVDCTSTQPCSEIW